MSRGCGGPAFPVKDYGTTQFPGMTLRDYFAAKAMTVVFGEAVRLLASGNFDHGGPWPAMCAIRAYEMADAMLHARDEPAGEMP